MVRFRSPGKDGRPTDTVRRDGSAVVLALALAAALPACLTEAAHAAVPPVPGRKPEPPPVAAPLQPEALAVPAAPDLAAPLPPRPKAGPAPDGNSLAAVPPPPEFPTAPVPSPPFLWDQTAALPPDPGPAPASAAPGIPAPPAAASLPRPPGLPEERAGPAPPPDPGPGAGTAAVEGREFSIVFGTREEVPLSPGDRTLLSGIAARMARDQNARLELRSYASGTEETRLEARRLSLLRAIDVREFLVGQGIRGTRIDVRALGASGEAPTGRAADRVDLVLVN